MNAVLKFVQQSTPNIAMPMSVIAIWHTVCILYVFNINTTLDVTNLGTNKALFFACGLLSRANSTGWQQGSRDVCQLADLFGPDWIILTAIGYIAMNFSTDIHGLFWMNPNPTFVIPSLALAPLAGWNWCAAKCLIKGAQRMNCKLVRIHQVKFFSLGQNTFKPHEQIAVVSMLTSKMLVSIAQI